MAFLLKNFLQSILKILAKTYLWRRKPLVIVVAGTANRHWLKENILSGFNKKKLLCRVSQKNFNAEIGLPLSILGIFPDENQRGKINRWFFALKKGLKIAFKKNVGEKEVLVLEMAIDKPDDMEYLLSIARPDIAVFSAITMIYTENFDNLDEIAMEYRKLIAALPKNGLALLNADDRRIIGLGQYTGAKVITYGVENQNADYLAQDIQKITTGQQFKIQTPEMTGKNIEIKRFGKHHIYAELVKEVILNKIINDQIPITIQ